MSLPNDTIWHLTHSSNMLKLADKLIVFDYPRAAEELKAGDGLHTGFIAPHEIRAEEVYVFISHGHKDHFHPDVFTWKDEIAKITYLVSSDIENRPPEALVVEPDESLIVNEIGIRTYPSTDLGVAFSLYIGDRHVYFSGDNAFWNWHGEDPGGVYVQDVLAQLDRSRPIDIAFRACDPRLDGKGAGGIYLFAETFNPRILVPLHTFGQYEFNRKAKAELIRQGYRRTFWRIDRPGAVFAFGEDR